MLELCVKPMNIETFWNVIEKSRLQFDPKLVDGNMDRQRAELARLLDPLPPEEIVSFRDHFRDLMDEAYSWDLWGAAYLIGEGCSDDAFVDFRAWLISMGREVFEQALQNPETLLGPSMAPGVEDIFFEGFAYVADRVYEKRARKRMPDREPGHLGDPKGQPWEEEDLEERFPALWKKFG
jgi:Protein of unknown function (DUF4240)